MTLCSEPTILRADCSGILLRCFTISLDDDQKWVAKIFEERADIIDADPIHARSATPQRVKPRTWRNRRRGNFEIGCYCSLRTTVRGRRSTQDIALFLYHDVAANLSGSGLVVVSFETGGELAEQFADAWFEKTDASLRKGLPNRENN